LDKIPTCPTAGRPIFYSILIEVNFSKLFIAF